MPYENDEDFIDLSDGDNEIAKQYDINSDEIEEEVEREDLEEDS